ncbi:MAG: glycosyl transferase, WecB/TagA/CpsF family [Firmicutes bacterium]|nr:glycosyl transferase, WecB/TagA/CpsF family [Bacillota bacterium]
MQTRVLGVRVDVVTMDKAVEILENFIAERVSRVVATANAEMIMATKGDSNLAQILEQADLVVPDGAGVVWAARYQGCKVPERVAGYDLVQRLLAQAASHGYRVYFFGGAEGVADKACQAAKKQYPGLKLAGTRNGFFSAKDERLIIEEIRSTRPDILLVALGVPKQEKWLATHLKELNVPVSIGVGGTFDVMAGNMKRAPLWMQRLNLEWLFRLLMQPKRALRMMALPRFVIAVIGAKKH